MNLTVEIPDELAGRLNAAGGDRSRRALEALALEEYKNCAACWGSVLATGWMVS
jgi:predicted transcriptional regulator